MLSALVQASDGSSTSGVGTAVVFGIIIAGIVVMVLLSGSLRRLRQNQDAGTFGSPRAPRRVRSARRRDAGSSLVAGSQPGDAGASDGPGATD